MFHGQSVAGVAFDGARKPAGIGFHVCPAIAGIQDQCLHVSVESDRSVNLCLDVTVQGVQPVGLGQSISAERLATPKAAGPVELSG